MGWARNVARYGTGRSLKVLWDRGGANARKNWILRQDVGVASPSRCVFRRFSRGGEEISEDLALVLYYSGSNGICWYTPYKILYHNLNCKCLVEPCPVITLPVSCLGCRQDIVTESYLSFCEDFCEQEVYE